MTKLQVLKLNHCHFERKGCWLDWWLNVTCTRHLAKLKMSMVALKMLMLQNRYTVPQCLFIVACTITRADFTIYNYMAQMLSWIWIWILSFSWSPVILSEHICYWYGFFLVKLIATLPQTSVSLLPSCFACLSWVMPQFCLMSVCS